MIPPHLYVNHFVIYCNIWIVKSNPAAIQSQK